MSDRELIRNGDRAMEECAEGWVLLERQVDSTWGRIGVVGTGEEAGRWISWPGFVMTDKRRALRVELLRDAPVIPTDPSRAL